MTRVYKERSQKIMDALKKRSLRLSSLETFEGKVYDAAGKNDKFASITVGTKSGVNTERSVQVALISPLLQPFVLV